MTLDWWKPAEKMAQLLGEDIKIGHEAPSLLRLALRASLERRALDRTAKLPCVALTA